MLTANALAVLRKRYLARDGERLVETPAQMFERVARHVASVEATCVRESSSIGHSSTFVGESWCI
jgi:ribonucleotide reductase alpha subunit